MRAIGIDLGTTNSAVASYDPDHGTAKIVGNAEGETLTPSAVAVRERDGRELLLVGRNAVNWAQREPRDTIVSVKRLMGRDYADAEVADARKRLSYEIVPGSDGDPRAHVIIAGTTRSPSQVSSFILHKLQQDASRTLGEEVTHAVITVPAYFREAQRAATRQAGEEAGLVVKKIIDEPTAAAVAFGLHLSKDDQRRVLVYDVGGGTFDISVLNVLRDADGHNHFQVLDFDGDNWLGGDDFDQVVVDLIIGWVREHCGVDPSADKKFLSLAKTHAEAAKRQLSQQDEADIVIAAAHRVPGGTLIDVDMTITRAQFDALIEPFVDKTMKLVQQALSRQDLTTDDITDVVLAGGSTLVPKVYQTVENFFGTGKVRRNVNPMECVALGAGILAGTLHGVECPSCRKVSDEAAANCAECGHSLASAPTVGDTGVYEVTGMALGIAAVRGTQQDVFVPIIKRGTPYPLSEPMRHSFQPTDGKRVRVPVYEGDSPVASENYEQGVVEYELTEEIDASARVDVAFGYNRDRIITVEISVPGTSNPVKKTELRRDTPRAAAAGMETDEEDSRGWREELVHAEQNAQLFLRRHEQFIEPRQAAKIRSHLEQVQQAQVLSDPAECRRMTDVLMTDVVDSGLASQIYLAERAADSASPEVARQINQIVGNVKDSVMHGRNDTAAEQGRILSAVVAKALRERDVIDIDDAADFQGLLRELDK
jgi:molecular chaperone DnaK